ncbi:hypothetical protein C8Q77DRAFT_1111531 [Trametes polyzona]|nr:hypothetical protein C8Q77DRAFT_1111531 [Trametes polyzona]
MPARSTRSRATSNAKVTRGAARANPRSKKAQDAVSDESSAGDSQDSGGEDAYQDDGDASEVESLDSDALDDEDLEASSRKRKRATASTKKTAPTKSLPQKRLGKNSSPRKSGATPRKKRKVTQSGEEDEEDDLELEEGQEIVGVVVQAPKTGRVPPGQISQNTLDFFTDLKKPECNDREWLSHPGTEPVYRLAESEWKAFVEHFTDNLVEVDPQIPHLPPKDVIHRIYRDIRFSNDKTPYKTGFSASFSRSGRKGIFAGFKPGGESLIAAGTWCPAKNELQTIRNNLLRSSRRLRQIISAPEFEALFGPARPHPKGIRQNVFGFEDELKVAPKGVDKNHKDIDLLKCRSFAVVHKFTDEQVLSPDFKEELARVVGVVRPFVHCLNDLMTIQDAGSSDSEDEDEGEVEPSDEGDVVEED